MAISDELRSQIDSVVGSQQVVLFMKGTRQSPQCGFSATVVGILDSLVPNYMTVNVLEDQEIREGIKEYSDWPTIPQLYIDKEFVGGCDIIKQMFNSGDLHGVLGVEAPDRTPPEIHISDAAAEVIRQASQGREGVAVHLTIDASWNHQLALNPAEGDEIKAQSNGVEILFDLASAQRARGLSIDMADTSQGRGFKVDNPNAPPPVKQMDVQELKQRLDRGDKLHLIDVRDPAERARAAIDGSRLLDQQTVQFIEALPKDETLVFYCHVGQRSLSAGNYFRLQGYTDVYNVEGGIDAWSRDIDPSVPRY